MATIPSSTIPNYTIDQQKQTVSGQLTNLLDQDNPYIKQARTQGQQYANKRGLLNSTMGAQASQDAAIQAAMPIAQADAQTHNQFAGQKYNAELQYDANATNNEFQHGLMQREQDFAASQNQTKFDQDWRMKMAEGSTEREVEALKQQAGLYAQFTKGVADINAADMSAGEKNTAVSSLWNQFQKGSEIANTLRNISISPDGSVSRSGSPASGSTGGLPTKPAAPKYSEVWGDGGTYQPGLTKNAGGQLVDSSGNAKPAAYTTRSGRTIIGYDYRLENGKWVSYRV